MRSRRVVLVGPMGSGKTAVGERLAARLSLEHVDTDDLVERDTDATIPEIFAVEGEEAFRARESAALRLALDGAPNVISTGGGIVTTERNRDLLAGSDALVVWLDADLDTLVARVGDGSGRPLLAGGDIAAVLAERLEARAGSYAAVAAVRLDTSDLSCAEVVDAIVAELQTGVRS